MLMILTLSKEQDETLELHPRVSFVADVVYFFLLDELSAYERV